MQAAASVMPVAGSGVAALMGLVGPKDPRQRRDEEWFELFADKISELESRVEGFAESPMFITAVVEATNAALKTHEREKLGALRNAVANSPLPGAPDDSTQLLFLRFVDQLTAAHLKILAVLDRSERRGREDRQTAPLFWGGATRPVVYALHSRACWTRRFGRAGRTRPAKPGID